MAHYGNLFLSLFGLVLMANQTYAKEVSTYSMMGDNIRSMLEQFRARMHMDMSESLGIARLDPFTVERLAFDGESMDLGDFTMNLTNIRVTGLNKFVVDEADFAIVGLKIVLNISIPTALVVTGNYKSDGYVGGMFLLDGEGPFGINITGLHLAVNGQMQYASGNWTVKSLSIDFGIKKLDVEFKGMVHMGDFINEMLSGIGPEVLDEMWPSLEPIVVEQAIEMMQDSLNKMTLAEMMAILSGTKEIFPPITES